MEINRDYKAIRQRIALLDCRIDEMIDDIKRILLQLTDAVETIEKRVDRRK